MGRGQKVAGERAPPALGRCFVVAEPPGPALKFSRNLGDVSL
jgi:hypothetical protein